MTQWVGSIQDDYIIIVLIFNHRLAQVFSLRYRKASVTKRLQSLRCSYSEPISRSPIMIAESSSSRSIYNKFNKMEPQIDRLRVMGQ
jgi:hypothetical protein